MMNPPTSIPSPIPPDSSDDTAETNIPLVSIAGAGGALAGMLNIGAVSRATGIPGETLRTWERRYGFPKPVRAQSGHRLYPPETVEQLILITQALAKGLRASHVIGLPLSDLRQMLDSAHPGPLPSPAHPPTESAIVSVPVLPALLPVRPRPFVGGDIQATLIRWMLAVQCMDARNLEHELRTECSRLGIHEFLHQLVGPFLLDLGEHWRTGRITVSQEHFAAERLRDFLTALWRPLAESNTGPVMVLATVADEMHTLGLQMAACLASLAGCQLVYLGMGVPVSEIVSAAVQTRAHSVLISVSSAADPSTSTSCLRGLRAILPPTTRIVVGGRGAPTDTDGLIVIRDLRTFWGWLAELAAESESDTDMP